MSWLLAEGGKRRFWRRIDLSPAGCGGVVVIAGGLARRTTVLLCTTDSVDTVQTLIISLLLHCYQGT
jgi:hypothetical protein